MSLLLDWWQIGWLLAGIFFVGFILLVIISGKTRDAALAIGHDQGWHDRQHWETDAVVKGKLERP
jgi:hypothetical protein